MGRSLCPWARRGRWSSEDTVPSEDTSRETTWGTIPTSRPSCPAGGCARATKVFFFTSPPLSGPSSFLDLRRLFFSDPFDPWLGWFDEKGHLHLTGRFKEVRRRTTPSPKRQRTHRRRVPPRSSTGPARRYRPSASNTRCCTSPPPTVRACALCSYSPRRTKSWERSVTHPLDRTLRVMRDTLGILVRRWSVPPSCAKRASPRAWHS